MASTMLGAVPAGAPAEAIARWLREAANEGSALVARRSVCERRAMKEAKMLILLFW
jgi:hypothetical protein